MAATGQEQGTSDVPADAAADAAATIAALQATIASLQTQLQTAPLLPQQGPIQQAPAVITPIQRPPGEAGSARRGYNLRDAMGLNDSTASRREYKQILNSVKLNCIKCKIDPMVLYKDQEPEMLAKIFKAGWRAHPYLTPERFPANWAQAAMIKQYIRNVRKHRRRLANGEGDDSDGPDGPDGSDGSHPGPSDDNDNAPGASCTV